MARADPDIRRVMGPRRRSRNGTAHIADADKSKGCHNIPSKAFCYHSNILQKLQPWIDL
jgi:hypothetical protein